MYTSVVKETDDGELYIELPQDLLDNLDWNETTELVWVVEEDGTIYLRKRDDDNSNEA